MFERLRSELARRPLVAGEVVLPGDAAVPLEGALHVVPRDGAFDLAVVDYGQPTRIASAPDEAQAEALVLAYVDLPLPAVATLDEAVVANAAAQAQPHITDLLGRATNGAILIDIPPGIAVDRLGALDGTMLFPLGTSFGERSLPPQAIQGEAQHIRLMVRAAIRVRAVKVAAWFGQPGGGLRFDLEQDGTGLTIRKLVSRGALERFTTQ